MNLLRLLQEQREHLEREIIVRALNTHDGVNVVAKSLGISRCYLYRRMQELKIPIPPGKKRCVHMPRIIAEAQDWFCGVKLVREIENESYRIVIPPPADAAVGTGAGGRYIRLTSDRRRASEFPSLPRRRVNRTSNIGAGNSKPIPRARRLVDVHYRVT